MSAARIGAYAGLAAAGLGWGATVVTGKIAASTGHHPVGLVFWQQVFTVLALAAVLTATQGLRWLGALGLRRRLGFYAGVALLGTVVPSSIFYAIAPHLPAGVMALIVSLVPMFSLTIALGLGLERRSARRAGGVALGAVAIAMIVLPETGLPDPAAWVFVVFGLLAPFLYGCEGIFVARRMPVDLDPIGAILGASVVGLLLTAPLMAVPAMRVDLSTAWGAPEWAVAIGALLHAGAYCGYVALVRGAGPVFASLVGYLVTASGVVWGIVILGEGHSDWFWAALAVMVTGLALVQPHREETAAA